MSSRNMRACYAGWPTAARSSRHFSASTTRRDTAQRSDFLEGFFTRQSPLPAATSYFSSLEWARKYLNDDRYEPIPLFGHHYDAPTDENRFLAKIASTPTTISHSLALRPKKPNLSPDPTCTAPEAMCLLSLGRDLASHPRIVHGGFQCIIFDEIMRLLVLLHDNKAEPPVSRRIHFTASMTTTFAAPLPAPSDVIARAWLTARQGRRWEMKADIVDSKGTTVSKAESTWVTSKEPISKEVNLDAHTR